MVKHERYAYTIKRARDFVEVDYVLSGRSHHFCRDSGFLAGTGGFLSPFAQYCPVRFFCSG